MTSKSGARDAQGEPTWPSASKDKLDAINAKMRELRDMEVEAADLEERASAIRGRIRTIKMTELPAMMVAASVRALEVEPDGNLPAYSAKVKPHYKAGILASWDPERRKAAFNYLESIGAGDLIKTEISIALPRDKREEANKLIKQLSKFSPEVHESVHAGTLTSWLKEQQKAGESIDLDLIGGEVGTMVEFKPSKQKD
jgi:hypothetical protein